MIFKYYIKLVFFSILFSVSIFSQDAVVNYEYDISEKPPIYPGCKGNSIELQKCFSKKFKKHFSRKFDSYLPNSLGLSSGKKNINITFKIDQEGLVDSIKVYAPHFKLKKEIKRVIRKLPKMIPAEQKGRNVGVKYSIPITIFIEESRKEKRERRKKEKELKRNNK